MHRVKYRTYEVTQRSEGKTPWQNHTPEQKKQIVCEKFLPLCLLQPSFLTSHKKQDSAAAVSIPVTANTHFRVISDTGPPSLTLYCPQPGETAALEGVKDTEENRREAQEGLTIKSGDTSGEEHGNYAVNLHSGLK